MKLKLLTNLFAATAHKKLRSLLLPSRSSQPIRMSSVKERPGGRRMLLESDLETDEDAENGCVNSKQVLEEPQGFGDIREFYSKSRKELSSGWRNFANNSCYIYLYRGGGEPNNVVAAFDLDGTLIKPKSNKKFPRNATDWDLFSVWTKIKLQQVLKDNQARFVIFTNQGGIGLNIVDLDVVQERIELVTKRLDVPCSVFMAVEKDEYRKPGIGMFKLLQESLNDSKPFDYERSFYCGDAVGYPSHSDADIKFAQKLGLPFITPEKFLRGVKPKLMPQEEKLELDEKEKMVTKE